MLISNKITEHKAYGAAGNNNNNINNNNNNNKTISVVITNKTVYYNRQDLLFIDKIGRYKTVKIYVHTPSTYNLRKNRNIQK